MHDLMEYGAAIAATFIMGWIVGTTTTQEERKVPLLLPARTALGRMQDCMRAMGIRKGAKMDSEEPEVWEV